MKTFIVHKGVRHELITKSIGKSVFNTEVLSSFILQKFKIVVVKNDDSIEESIGLLKEVNNKDVNPIIVMKLDGQEDYSCISMKWIRSNAKFFMMNTFLG